MAKKTKPLSQDQKDFLIFEEKFFNALKCKYDRMTGNAHNKDYARDWFLKGVSFISVVIKEGDEYQRQVLSVFKHNYRLGLSIDSTFEYIENCKAVDTVSFSEIEPPETNTIIKEDKLVSDKKPEQPDSADQTNKNKISRSSDKKTIIRFLAKYVAFEKFMQKHNYYFPEQYHSDPLLPKLPVNPEAIIVAESSKNKPKAAVSPEETKEVVESANDPAIDDNDLMLIEQASAFTQIPIDTIYDYVHDKKIPYMKPGKRLFFSKKALTEWMLSKRVMTRKEAEEEAERNPIWGRKKGKKK